ncbi:MAG: hypothetical protein AAF743_00295 [Planctomycetota bacterium]
MAFWTPLDRCTWFAQTILNTTRNLETLHVRTETIGLSHDELDSLRIAAGEPRAVHKAPFHIATGLAAAESLLSACFAGWLDFVAIAKPNEVGIAADHDELCRVYARRSGQLADISTACAEAGVNAADTDLDVGRDLDRHLRE